MVISISEPCRSVSGHPRRQVCSKRQIRERERERARERKSERESERECVIERKRDRESTTVARGRDAAGLRVNGSL